MPYWGGANATITNAAAVMTNRIVIDVDTNGFVTVTGVSVNTPVSNLQTQCFSTGKGMREEMRAIPTQ